MPAHSLPLTVTFSPLSRATTRVPGDTTWRRTARSHPTASFWRTWRSSGGHRTSSRQPPAWLTAWISPDARSPSPAAAAPSAAAIDSRGPGLSYSPPSLCSSSFLFFLFSHPLPFLLSSSCFSPSVPLSLPTRTFLYPSPSAPRPSSFSLILFLLSSSCSSPSLLLSLLSFSFSPLYLYSSDFQP